MHCNEEVNDDDEDDDDDDEDDSEADVEEAWEGEGRRSARPRKGEPASTHSNDTIGDNGNEINAEVPNTHF